MANIPQRCSVLEVVADIDIKILGVPPSGPGMPFLDSHTCAEGGLFISARVLFPV
jgi:hypothetical protein